MEQGIPPDEPIKHVKPQYVSIYIYIYISLYYYIYHFVNIYITLFYIIIINVFVKCNKKIPLDEPIEHGKPQYVFLFI